VDAKRAPGPTWETVRYMVAAIQYGGRITDEFDKLLMQTYAERYFHQVPPGPAAQRRASSATTACLTCWGMPM
jgi:hypothetical protein